MESKPSNQRGRREWPGKKVSPPAWPMPEGGYKEFPLMSLFDSMSGNFDIQSKHLTGKGISVVSAGATNNGIIGKSNIFCKIIEAPSITIDMFGHVFFQSQSVKLVTHARVFALVPKFSVSNEACIYLTALISKLCNAKFSYSSMASWNKIKNLSIMLPCTSLGDIDFEFMRSRMRELEEERMRELETYLSEAGFQDCELTPEERESLYKFQSGKVKFIERKIFDDLFTVQNSHNILKTEVVLGSGTTPYVTAGEGNNSIMGYISYKTELLEPANSILIGGKTMVVTYQKDAYFSNDSHNLVLRLKEKNNPTENENLFFVSTLVKALSHKYHWGDSISKSKIKNDCVQVPINDRNEIDYDFMENIISAVKKQIIQRLKKEIDIEKAAYKEVVPGKSIDKLEKPDSYQLAAEPFEIYGYSDFESTSQINSEEPMLVGYFRTREQKNWILKNNLFNVRMGNRKGSMEEYKKLFDKTNILILHGNVNVDRKIRIYRLSNPREKTGKDMKDLDYPVQDINCQYAIFDIEEIDNPDINKAVIVNDIKKKLGARHLKSVFLTS